MYQSIDDVSLLQKIIEQDQSALSQLYDRYARIMYSLAFKVLGSAEEAEEVVLDVLSYVWKKAATYNAKRGRVDGWLFLMVRSRAIDRWRKRQKYASAFEASAIEAKSDMASTSGTPDEMLMISERRDRVLSAMDELPLEQRQVIEFAYYQGMSQSEIANKMGTSVGTVKTRVRLGLSKLRGLLDMN
ncbi:MAG: sigma-70 family RNA polymerase sigma factor [Cyanobacteria bacterium P01_F01_bin.150]